jgi:hypothetical protein
MDQGIKTSRIFLEKRELELQRLIRQMKLDQLYNSKVYKNLEEELDTIKSRLREEVL